MSDSLTRLQPLVLAGIIFLAEEDLRAAYVWLCNERKVQQGAGAAVRAEGGVARLLTSLLRDVRRMLRWMVSQNSHIQMLGFVFGVISILSLSVVRRIIAEGPASEPTAAITWTAALGPAARRESAIPAEDRVLVDMLLVPFALAGFLHGSAFFSHLLFPLEKLGVFYTTCFMMLRSDVKDWLLLFLICTRPPLVEPWHLLLA